MQEQLREKELELERTRVQIELEKEERSKLLAQTERSQMKQELKSEMKGYHN
jgi:hypothetical protein